MNQPREQMKIPDNTSAQSEQQSLCQSFVSARLSPSQTHLLTATTNNCLVYKTLSIL